MTCRILFVDDEQGILRGMRRMLFEFMDSWDMHFADSGDKALAILQTQPFDIVISDLKMPGMDGIALLKHVRELHPAVVRIVLSGYSDSILLSKSTIVAHQFLSKPVSVKEIQKAVQHVLALRDLFLDSTLQEAITRLDTLPVLPATYDRLLRLASSETATLREITALVTQDFALTASILKLVNSSFFGGQRHIEDPAHAVTLLGVGVIKALILLQNFISTYNPDKHPRFAIELLWKHSQNTAFFAKIICELENQEKKITDYAFIGGLMHDIGKLILSECCARDYRTILSLARERNITSHEAEREIISKSHAEIGAYLMGLWGFEATTIQAVAFHHRPGGAAGHSLVAAVHAANALEHELMVLNPGYAPHPVDMEYLQTQGLADRYDVWREACRKHIEDRDDEQQSLVR